MKPAAKFLSARELIARLGIPKSSFYRYVADGYLPKPVRIAPRCVRWPIAEVEAFEHRLAADRGTGPADPGVSSTNRERTYCDDSPNRDRHAEEGLRRNLQPTAPRHSSRSGRRGAAEGSSAHPAASVTTTEAGGLTSHGDAQREDHHADR